MTKDQIKELALRTGFKLKEQPDGEMDLNPYVYEFAEKLIEYAYNDGYDDGQKSIADRLRSGEVQDV